MTGRILGVDYGTVRIGLAVTDSERRFASPLAMYQRNKLESDACYFQTLVKEEAVGSIVVGLPVHMDGREGQKAVEARQFAEWLAKTTELPVTLWDERFTTVEAENALLGAKLTKKKRKQRVDMLAAQMMLQSYLEAECPEDATPGPLDK